MSKLVNDITKRYGSKIVFLGVKGLVSEPTVLGISVNYLWGVIREALFTL